MDNKEKFGGVWAAFAVVCAAVVAVASPLTDLDWLGVRLGGIIFETHKLPAADAINYLPVRPDWWDAAWLTHLLAYLLDRMGGTFALSAAGAVIAGCAAYLLFRASKSENVSAMLSAATVAVGFAILKPYMAFGPHLVGMFLFSIAIFLIERRRYSPVAFFAVFLIWSQCGEGFIAGLVYLVAMTVADKSLERKRKIAAIISAFVGCSISPTGYRLLFDYGAERFINGPSPDFHYSFTALGAMLTLGMFALNALSEKRANALVAVAAVFVIALAADNFFPCLIIATIAPFAYGSAALSQRPGFSRIGHVLLAASAALLAMGVTIAVVKFRQEADLREFFDRVNERKCFGEILSPLPISGKAAMFTGKKIAFDPRANLFPPDSSFLFTVLNRPDEYGWDETADRLKIGAVVVPSASANYAAIAMKKGWALVYEGGGYGYFLRDKGLNSSIINKWGAMRPKATLATTPAEIAADLAGKGAEYLSIGNPYRAAWYAKDALRFDPANESAKNTLSAADEAIKKAGEGAL